MKRLLSICIVVLTTLTSGWAQQSTLGKLPVLSLASPGTSTTAGIQESIDRFNKATGVTGIGGGELDIGPGFYYLSTNLWVPGKWPYKLHVKGAGDQATFIIYTGPTNTGLVRCEANNAGAVTGLTNNINLEWEGCTLSYVTNSTNFIFALENVNFVKIHDNVLANYECLTNGDGIYTLCFEADRPTDIPATAGISLYWANEPNNGQGTFDIYNNSFYGLACSFHNGGIRGTFHHNKLFNNGFYKSGGTRYGHTNAFTFDYTQSVQQGRAGITTGAAIVNESSGNMLVEGNHFSYCGLILYQDSPTSGQISTIGFPVMLFGNSYESCQYRVASWNQGDLLIASLDYAGPGTPSINDVNALPTDVVVTNSATKVQPNAVIPTTDFVTGFRIYPQSAFVAGGGYISVNGLMAFTNGTTGITPNNTNFTSYAAGTAYTLTASAAALTFGTTQPVLTINQAGTYKITGKVGIKYSSATYAGAQTVTLKFRRTNNTAADLTSGSRAVELPVLTTFTGGDVMPLPDITYTATSGDTVTIFGILSATPSAGSVQADSAELMAERLY